MHVVWVVFRWMGKGMKQGGNGERTQQKDLCRYMENLKVSQQQWGVDSVFPSLHRSWRLFSWRAWSLEDALSLVFLIFGLPVKKMFFTSLGNEKQKYFMVLVCCMEGERVIGRERLIMGLLWQLMITVFSSVWPSYLSSTVWEFIYSHFHFSLLCAHPLIT